MENRVVIRTGRRILFIYPDEIDWLEADGNFVRIHSGAETHLLRIPLSLLEQKLDSEFMRIHRSTIVNINRIREVQHWFRGRYRVLMRDGTALIVSQAYREKIDSLMQQPFVVKILSANPAE
jgi:two-component system, LytTR family, response regulator